MCFYKVYTHYTKPMENIICLEIVKVVLPLKLIYITDNCTEIEKNGKEHTFSDC